MVNAMMLLVRSVLRLCVAAALLGAASGAQAALSFHAEVATRHQAASGASNVPPDATRASEVVLGERYMSVSAPGQLNIFDFTSRRRYQVDPAAATYVDYSLFDTVGMRAMELRNRDGLRRAMATMKVAAPASDPVFDEQSLSVAAQPPRSMSVAADGPDTVLSVDGKALLRIGAGGTPVGAADAAAFGRYLRYQFGGHPLVLAKLAALGRIPASFVMYYQEVGGTQTRTFSISALTATAPPTYDLARFAERAGGADEIDQLLDRARRTPLPSPEQDRLAYEAEVTAAFSEQRALDAMLGTIEWTLMSGAPMVPFSADRKALLQADPAVRSVLAAMNPSDKAGLSAAVQVMQSMRAQTMRKRHMLQLFEANDRMKLGERATALQLFASVLRANPALAGAYKDMGDTLFAGFDMPRAWRSWDAGRRIAPALNLFTAVNQFEQTLLRDYPEYF